VGFSPTVLYVKKKLQETFYILLIVIGIESLIEKYTPTASLISYLNIALLYSGILASQK
jgi:hypothetical protein